MEEYISTVRDRGPVERTYNVGVHTDVEDERAGRHHPLAPAEEVDGDGGLQQAASHPNDRRDHRVPIFFPPDGARMQHIYTQCKQEPFQQGQTGVY